MKELTDLQNRDEQVKEGDFIIWLDLSKLERKVYLFEHPKSELVCIKEFADLVREHIIVGHKVRLTMVKWNNAINIKTIREVRLEDYSSYVG